MTPEQRHRCMVACAEQGYEARNDGEALSFCPWVQIQDSREEPAWQARYRAAQISCGDICERVLLAWARGVRLLLFPEIERGVLAEQD